MPNQAVGFAGLLAGGVLLTAAITGDPLTAVVTGKATGAKPLGGSSGGQASASGSDPDADAPSDAPTGTTKFDGVPVAAWIAPILQQARDTGIWKGQLKSGWRSYAEQSQLYNDFIHGLRSGPVAKPGESNHEGSEFPAGAADVSDPQGLNAALVHLGITNLQWAGAKDPPHFSNPHDGGY